VTELLTLGAQRVVQELLEHEVTAFLGREHYRRGPRRIRGYRNGYRIKHVPTAEGTIPVQVPSRASRSLRPSTRTTVRRARALPIQFLLSPIRFPPYPSAPRLLWANGIVLANSAAYAITVSGQRHVGNGRSARRVAGVKSGIAGLPQWGRGWLAQAALDRRHPAGCNDASRGAKMRLRDASR
jgi:hypothetical protein